MRLTCLLLGLLVCWGTLAAQPAPPAAAARDVATVRALYRLTFQPDSLDPTKKLQENFQLLIGKSTSRFVSAERPRRDSAMAKIDTEIGRTPGVPTISLVGIPRTRFSFYIFKNFASQQLTAFEQILLVHYRIEESSAALAWRILPDTQRVAGYACQRAAVDYGGRHWLAWFTREVPISDGPYKFSGLPGLIVQVQDTQSFYVFALTSLTTLPSGPVIALPTWPTRPATRAQMRQTMYDYKRNPFAFMDTHGTPVSGPDQQTYYERSKGRNNAIERH